MGTRRLLSSRSTAAYKYFWPAFNAIAFLGITILLWRMSVTKNTGAVWLGRFALPLIGIGTTAYAIWYGNGLNRVEMDDDGLYISNYRRKIHVPFSEIDTCEVNWEGQRDATPVVTIKLSRPTALGAEIRFMAALPWNISHSIVAELRERRDQAKARRNDSQ